MKNSTKLTLGLILALSSQTGIEYSQLIKPQNSIEYNSEKLQANYYPYSTEIFTKVRNDAGILHLLDDTKKLDYFIIKEHAFV